MTTQQQSAVAYIQRLHVGCAMTTRCARHDYIEVDVWTREQTKIYEVAPDGRYSRAA